MSSEQAVKDLQTLIQTCVSSTSSGHGVLNRLQEVTNCLGERILELLERVNKLEEKQQTRLTGFHEKTDKLKAATLMITDTLEKMNEHDGCINERIEALESRLKEIDSKGKDEKSDTPPPSLSAKELRAFQYSCFKGDPALLEKIEVFYNGYIAPQLEGAAKRGMDKVRIKEPATWTTEDGKIQIDFNSKEYHATSALVGFMRHQRGLTVRTEQTYNYQARPDGWEYEISW